MKHESKIKSYLEFVEDKENDDDDEKKKKKASRHVEKSDITNLERQIEIHRSTHGPTENLRGSALNQRNELETALATQGVSRMSQFGTRSAPGGHAKGWVQKSIGSRK